jgi:hypothetical protein
MAVSIDSGGDELGAAAKEMRDNPKQYFENLLKEERAEIKQETKIVG